MEPILNQDQPVQTHVSGHQQTSYFPRAGSAFASIGGALIDMHRDDIANARYQDNARKAYERSSASAAAVAANNRSNMYESERYNSVPEYVRQLKQAGLSPMLAYGSMSMPSVSGSSSPAASADVAGVANTPVGSSLASNLTSSVMAAAQIDNLHANTASQSEDVVTKKAENELIRTKVQMNVLEQIARINKMHSESSLSDEQKKNLVEMRDTLQRYYDSMSSRNAAASELDFEKVNTEKTIQGLNSAKTDTEETLQESNKANAAEARANADYTKGVKTKLTESQILTEESLKMLNEANASLADVKNSELIFRLNLDQKQFKTIHKYVKEYNLPAGSEKSIMLALEEFSKSTGKSVPENLASWLNGGTWLHYLGMTNFASNKDSGLFDRREHVSEPDSRGDVVKTVPSDKILKEHVMKQVKRAGEDSFIDEFLKGDAYLSSYLSKYEYAEYKKQLFYSKDYDDLKQRFYWWYYSAKNGTGFSNSPYKD